MGGTVVVTYLQNNRKLKAVQSSMENICAMERQLVTNLKQMISFREIKQLNDSQKNFWVFEKVTEMHKDC